MDPSVELFGRAIIYLTNLASDSACMTSLILGILSRSHPLGESNILLPHIAFPLKLDAFFCKLVVFNRVIEKEVERVVLAKRPIYNLNRSVIALEFGEGLLWL